MERPTNLLEYFVHHEDLRRAQPGWEPRHLAAADQDRLWSAIRSAGAGWSARPACRCGSAAATPDAVAVLRRGLDPVTITGLPSELVMFLFGRDQARGLEFGGPPDRVGEGSAGRSRLLSVRSAP